VMSAPFRGFWILDDHGPSLFPGEAVYLGKVAHESISTDFLVIPAETLRPMIVKGHRYSHPPFPRHQEDYRCLPDLTDAHYYVATERGGDVEHMAPE